MCTITLPPNDYDTELSQKIREEAMKQNKTTHEIQREIFYQIFDIPSNYSVKNRTRCISRIFAAVCKSENVSQAFVTRRYLRGYFGMPIQATAARKRLREVKKGFEVS